MRRSRQKGGAVQIVVEFNEEDRVKYFHVLQPQDGTWIAYRKTGTTLKKLRTGLKIKKRDSIVIRRRKK